MRAVITWIAVALCCGPCRGFLLTVTDMCDYVAHLQCNHATTGPICGKNGITYQDRCEFSKAFCKDPAIGILHLGPCLQQQEKQAAVLSVVCPALLGLDCHLDDDTTSYCASNGNTYLGACRFEKARCHNKSLYLRHTGPCQ